MIQRLQSLWLLLACVFAFLTLKIPFFSGNILINNASVYQEFTAMSYMLLMILTVIVGAGSLVAIFLYNNRNLQWKVALVLFVFSVLNLVMFFIATGAFVPKEWSYNLTSFAAIIIPVLLLAAARGIYKDEKLVKSVDRLR
jgi:hypothetical protein